MKINSMKQCDICQKVVAEKYGLILYHTLNPYVTVRFDEPVTYGNMEEHTTTSKGHFCQECYEDFKKILIK